MRFKSQFAGVVVGILMLLAATASADVPQLITYQGILTDSVGAPYDGTKQVQFQIYYSHQWHSSTLKLHFFETVLYIQFDLIQYLHLKRRVWLMNSFLKHSNRKM